MAEKKKVLVVDDDKNLVTVLLDKLDISGFEAQATKNGEEGLAKALDWHPDVILMDVVMPKMDGWQMLKKLREDNWGKTARVIMLTVLENPDNVAKAMEEGTFDYITKTDWSLDDVVKKIEAIFEK